MDFIVILGLSAILVATGVITPEPKDQEVVEKKKNKNGGSSNSNC